MRKGLLKSIWMALEVKREEPLLDFPRPLVQEILHLIGQNLKYGCHRVAWRRDEIVLDQRLVGDEFVNLGGRGRVEQC